MTTNLPVATTSGRLTTNSDAELLARRLVSWRPSDEVPDDATPERLASLQTELTLRLEPAGAEATAAILYELFLVLPAPAEAAMAKYIERLQTYPAWALKAAIDKVIDNHKYASTPTIGDIIETMRALPGYIERFRIRANVSILQIRQRRNPPRPRQAVCTPPPAPKVKPVPREPLSARQAEEQMLRDQERVRAEMAADGMDGAVDERGNLVESPGATV
jgi:hypothetical protein